MKRYNSPKLEAKGSIIEQTLGVGSGYQDPSGTELIGFVGSIGFNL